MAVTVEYGIFPFLSPAEDVIRQISERRLAVQRSKHFFRRRVDRLFEQHPIAGEIEIARAVFRRARDRNPRALVEMQWRRRRGSRDFLRSRVGLPHRA